MKQKPLLLLFLAVFFTFNLANAQASGYCTPKYSGKGNPTTSQPTPFYTHILRVALGEIDRQTAEPTSVYTNTIYQDFSKSDTARLTQTGKYPLNLALGNGANPQTFAIWIDYNQNGVFENSERIYSKTDEANKGDHTYSTTITIPKNAVLGNTRMRVGTLFGNKIPSPCNNSRPDDINKLIIDWSQHFQDYSIVIVKPNIQLFENVEVVQNNFDEVEIGSADNDIMRIDVTTNSDGVISPLTVDTFYLSLMGCSDPGDIKRAKLYYTGKDPNFSTSNLVDSLSNPKLDFKLTSNTNLKQGTNYFWLCYDVRKTALNTSRIDARCNGIYVVAKRIPKQVSPAGDRPLGYCVAKGNRSMFVYVRRVQFNTINLYSTWNNTGYSNYTSRTTDVVRGDSVTLSVEVGNGVNNSFTKAWIDFNADGDFDDANERVLFDSITTASVSSYTYGPVTARVKIPANAKVGPTRMRIISASKTDVFPWKLPPNACDKIVEIGEVEDYTVYITEDGEPVADFNFSTVCSGDSTQFTDKSYTYNSTFYAIKSWKWNFGDGGTSTKQNPKHLYAKAGIYKVSLVVNTNKPGTPDTIYKIVTVENPQVNFSLNTTLSKTDITFTDQTRNANVVFWQWDFGDPTSPMNTGFGPTPQFKYDTSGTYQVKLAVRTLGGCEDSVIKTIKIVSELKPIANFNAATFEPYKTAATEMVDLSANRPNKWTWKVRPSSYSFVNGTSSSSRNPEIAFNGLHKYTVTLIAENGAGLDSISRQFTTKDYKKPTADFSANQTAVKAGQIVSFLDLSTNDPTIWNWKFGDGDSSETSNPVHQYALTGKYTVKLKVANPAGKDSKTAIDYINVSDEYVMCENDVQSSPLFNGTLYDSGGKKGNYGSSEECSFLIQPECSGPISLAFSEFSLRAGDFVRIYDYDANDNVKVPLHSGPGFTGLSKPPTLKSVLGAVIVEMSTDASGDSTGFKLVWSASPNIKPQAKIQADSVGYVNSAMIITNKTNIGTDNRYYWDVDNDGINDDSSATFVSVLFSKRGVDTVRFVAVNCAGSDTIYHIVRVDSATKVPTAKFYADKTKIYTNDEVKFYDLSTQGPNAWKWEVHSDPFNYMFVNGTDAKSRNPQILFFEPGYYSISLTASNDLGSGTKETKNQYILVQTRRQLCLYPFNDVAPAGRLTDDGGENAPYKSTSCDFLIQPCAKEVLLDIKEFDYGPGDYLRVYDGVDASGTPLHPSGGFTNGSKATAKTLVAKSGAMYIVHSSGTNPANHSGFVADWSSLPFDNPEIDFSAPDTAYTGGNVVFLQDKTDAKGNPFLKWKWDFTNDGKVDDTLQNTTTKYAKNGTYTVELRVDACEFSDSIMKDILVIHPKGKPKARFQVSQVRGATTDIFYFKDRSTNGPGEWRWEFNPPTFKVASGGDSLPVIGVLFNKPDTYDVKLYVKNFLGEDSLLKKDHIIVYEYCKPKVLSKAVEALSIAYFSLGSISHSSSNFDSTYTNFSQQYETKLTRGGKHPIVIGRTTNTPGMNIKVWIDYNKDGDFDDTLETALVIPNSSASVYTDTLVVPMSVAEGPTRLRVGTSLTSNTNNPCGPNDYGEFEDYRVIIGPDETRPVISLLGPQTVFAEVGYSYVDSGATAWDNIDGNITSKIVTTSNVDTAKAGDYEVTFNVSDAAGNKALEVRRKVVMLPDQTLPTITLQGANPMDLEVFSHFVDPGAKAFDNLDGDISNNIVVKVNIDTARLGQYEVIYSAVDNAGNYAQAVTRVVNVVDTEAPVITLRGSASVILKFNEKYVEDSADVSDNYYNDVDLIISGAVNTKQAGIYKIYYDATDRSGNSAVQQVRTVTVEEKIGFEEVNMLSTFEVYPNPGNEVVFVKLGSNQSLKTRIRLVDVLGKEFYFDELNLQGQKIITLPTAGLASGVYYVEVMNDQQSETRKITIAH
ncbi:DUF5011 domain-containing protein [bacterium]|nr:DUF5011 domain-containing protein [bacterium]